VDTRRFEKNRQVPA